ncbi:hypothetical protein ANACOL_02670 [Anaerotruncus colihominis DSM 17241]|uniref:Uncharacterized protein n=1 Tax=Anaerotruncus colihominis DSM 17241 TaxID=445972 RepID=B0PD07_9FIRM|nr:hypothetical protein ANACOL_02670 [Anaerotruncus colihominis DSM 17241]
MKRRLSERKTGLRRGGGTPRRSRFIFAVRCPRRADCLEEIK